jgi:hypothetical protein
LIIPFNETPPPEEDIGVAHIHFSDPPGVCHTEIGAGIRGPLSRSLMGSRRRVCPT